MLMSSWCCRKPSSSSNPQADISCKEQLTILITILFKILSIMTVSPIWHWPSLKYTNKPICDNLLCRMIDHHYLKPYSHISSPFWETNIFITKNTDTVTSPHLCFTFQIWPVSSRRSGGPLLQDLHQEKSLRILVTWMIFVLTILDTSVF